MCCGSLQANSSVLALLVVENADVPTPLGVQLVPDSICRMSSPRSDW